MFFSKMSARVKNGSSLFFIINIDFLTSFTITSGDYYTNEDVGERWLATTPPTAEITTPQTGRERVWGTAGERKVAETSYWRLLRYWHHPDVQGLSYKLSSLITSFYIHNERAQPKVKQRHSSYKCQHATSIDGRPYGRCGKYSDKSCWWSTAP